MTQRSILAYTILICLLALVAPVFAPPGATLLALTVFCMAPAVLFASRLLLAEMALTGPVDAWDTPFGLVFGLVAGWTHFLLAILFWVCYSG